jgi:hypothetical protein
MNMESKLATENKIRNTALNKVRSKSKIDPSPSWEGALTWSGEKFTSHFHEAMKYYNVEYSKKDLKPVVIDWMQKNDYSRADISKFKQSKDSRCNSTMGAIAACMLRGMPSSHPGFNNGRDMVKWLREEITQILNSEDIEEQKEEAEETASSFNIQERIREQAAFMSEELDYEIDKFITNPNEFDPKAIKVINLLKAKGAKAPHVRYIKAYFHKGAKELAELSSGNADEQLREAFKHHPRKNVRKLIEFYDSIIESCNQIAAESKVLRKPRTKKSKSTEDLTKKLKFCIKDDKLGIVSIPPATIIGAQGVVVFNVRTRKLGYYISKSSAGLGIRGSSITEFTEKSIHKTLRKPVEQIREFREQNTQRRFETWFNNIKTTDVALTGRINEDTIILKAFK